MKSEEMLIAGAVALGIIFSIPKAVESIPDIIPSPEPLPETSPCKNASCPRGNQYDRPMLVDCDDGYGMLSITDWLFSKCTCRAADTLPESCGNI